MDEDLRSSIDRLISIGGRLTVRGSRESTPTVVVLDQPGSRFGILEVHGRTDLDASDPAVVVLLAGGWSDPTVTQRHGREVRIGSGAADAGQTIRLTRTWRVPPVLASELALDVRRAASSVEHVELEPLAGQRGSPAAALAAAPQPAAAIEDAEERAGPPPRRRSTARTLPAPLRAIGAAAIVAIIAVVWVGLVRGSPRVVGGASVAPSSHAGVASPALTGAAVTPVPSASPVLLHLVAASTEESDGPALDAIDGDPVTAWHAAFGVPQWIEIGLDAASTVHQVVLLVAQTDDGPSRHMIQVQVGGVYQVVGIVDRLTKDGEPIVFRPSTPIENVERIRIETMASPSNAGWYEVVVR